eukprot:snap_masked-scaffold_5-processed-gene-2.24-mRNA-1 protein AED:1.00 eAED:1.00 QI:0/0/0/0/1/1/2/0/111
MISCCWWEILRSDESSYFKRSADDEYGFWSWGGDSILLGALLLASELLFVSTDISHNFLRCFGYCSFLKEEFGYIQVDLCWLSRHCHEGYSVEFISGFLGVLLGSASLGGV